LIVYNPTYKDNPESKTPDEVGQAANPIPQIGKIAYPFLTTENGSSPDIPIAGDEAETDAVTVEQRHRHKFRISDLNSE